MFSAGGSQTTQNVLLRTNTQQIIVFIQEMVEDVMKGDSFLLEILSKSGGKPIRKTGLIKLHQYFWIIRYCAFDTISAVKNTHVNNVNNNNANKHKLHNKLL